MTAEVLTTRTGPVGRLTLNRARALHSLSQGMCDRLAAALLEWRDDPGVELVMLDHAPGTRGFCAGGDVVAARASVLDDGGAAARAFFMAEYRLNHLLYTYRKPVVAFMDGVTMGGGVGIVLPARFRVATENTLFAMPEGAIGLFPDVGAGLYLSRLPGQLGKFLALTAARLDGAECLWAGLATHYLASDDLDEAKAAIAREPAAADEILRDLSSAPPPARLEKNAGKIDRLFAPDTLEGILSALAADGSDWAGKEWKAVAAKCPTSAKVALRQIATAPAPAPADFAMEMTREYALAARMIVRHDFIEGVRAVLVDKDNNARWDPATPAGVSDALLDQIFAPLPAGEEWTPFPAAG